MHSNFLRVQNKLTIKTTVCVPLVYLGLLMSGVVGRNPFFLRLLCSPSRSLSPSFSSDLRSSSPDTTRSKPKNSGRQTRICREQSLRIPW